MRGIAMSWSKIYDGATETPATPWSSVYAPEKDMLLHFEEDTLSIPFSVRVEYRLGSNDTWQVLETVNAAHFVINKRIRQMPYMRFMLEPGPGAAITGGVYGDIPTSHTLPPPVDDFITRMQFEMFEAVAAMTALEDAPSNASVNWYLIDPNEPLTQENMRPFGEIWATVLTVLVTHFNAALP